MLTRIQCRMLLPHRCQFVVGSMKNMLLSQKSSPANGGKAHAHGRLQFLRYRKDLGQIAEVLGGVSKKEIVVCATWPGQSEPPGERRRRTGGAPRVLWTLASGPQRSSTTPFHAAAASDLLLQARIRVLSDFIQRRTRQSLSVLTAGNGSRGLVRTWHAQFRGRAQSAEPEDCPCRLHLCPIAP